MVLVVVAGVIAFSPGCENVMQNMYDQPKYKPLSKSDFFSDGQSARSLVPETVIFSSGSFAGSSSGREGKAAFYLPKGKIPSGEIPLPITVKLLKRGQERFNIYCAPCHGQAGHGDGMIVRRGFPSPPSYHSARLRDAPDAHFYNVMTQGFGRMFSYAARVEPQDRWAIVAYIRALQLSQNATLKDIPEETIQRQLEKKNDNQKG
ncbi:conserved hypothetical protein [Nitrosococcus watsonii C-113]|uniref:Cytochrome c domain-containing protein n=1 Tax=Nitrosococcus watsoni (strain C-113) TaxID=105559 RepID=D8K586_NITWC|nr:conserved hypothetical protein [Nitrosococcus watsonii C-113]